MEILIKVLQFILSLSILIIIHECGHFFFAKLFKARVEKFFLFFNPWFSLFKIKKGETEYGIGWIPLGGYVKISGMIDESMDLEQMKQPPQPYEFRSKSTWQRLLIMLGGVLVNFIFALIIYVAILYTWGENYLPLKNAKYGIAVDSLAYNAGLRSGDFITSVDNAVVDNFNMVITTVVLNQAKSIQVLRDNQKVNIILPKNFINALINKKQEVILPRVPFLIGGFAKNSPGKDAGLKIGDRLIAVDGKRAEFFDEFKTQALRHKNQVLKITVDRKGKSIDIVANVPKSGILGIAQEWDLSKFFVLKNIKYGFFESIPAGISKGFGRLGDYIKSFKLVFSSSAKGYESLGGFMTMGSIFPSVWDGYLFWSLTAFLSIILAFMNILPIPALDGGHILFLLYEMITGKKPSDKFLEYAQLVGLILIVAILLYANLNDVHRFIFKK
jgi:regulator of sigma E protease